MSNYELLLGDCLELLPTLPSGSVDAIVCDPPYGLSFMGKDWDHGVPGVPFWTAALRVAKPGAMLLAFGGTRTHHRLMCAIEDAGWEIRDCLAWIYGQGFPKSHNYSWEMHEQACSLCGIMVEYDYEKTTIDSTGNQSAATRTARGKSEAKHGMRFVRATYLQTPVYACAQCGQVLQPFMPKQDTQAYRRAWAESKFVWPEQSSMEGRGDLEATEGELQGCSLCTLSGGVYADGAQGWLHNGASTCDGPIPWQVANEDGSCPSYRPQSSEQLHRQPDAIRLERAAQKARGFGTALKPSFEPIIMAMKPLDGTFANNALAHGCGGVNVDACRIGAGEDRISGGLRTRDMDNGSSWQHGSKNQSERPSGGRWPANLILDEEAAAMLDEQSGRLTSGKPNGAKRNANGPFLAHANGAELTGFGDSGGASRFFYVAKAAGSDRGKDNEHPTVKPTELMRYLCRLITRPNALVLDPFMGSGSTGCAAIKEGRHFIGVELDEHYFAIAEKRIAEAAMQLPLFEMA